MIYQIKRWDTNAIIIDGEAESMREFILAQLKIDTNLSRSNLSGSDLSGSDLSGSDLSRSNLSRSDLSGSDLSRSNLSGSDLSRSDLSRSVGIAGYICFGPIGSRNNYTWARWVEGSYIVTCGCFTGDIDEFEKKVIETYGDCQGGHGKEYQAAIALMRLRADATKPEAKS